MMAFCSHCEVTRRHGCRDHPRSTRLVPRTAETEGSPGREEPSAVPSRPRHAGGHHALPGRDDGAAEKWASQKDDPQASSSPAISSVSWYSGITTVSTGVLVPGGYPACRSRRSSHAPSAAIPPRPADPSTCSGPPARRSAGWLISAMSSASPQAAPSASRPRRPLTVSPDHLQGPFWERHCVTEVS